MRKVKIKVSEVVENEIKKVFTRKRINEMARRDSPLLPPMIVDNGVVKQWVGIGWVWMEDEPLKEEYPRIIN